jgi:hypothetical protein
MGGDRAGGLCAVLDLERGARRPMELRGPLDVAVFHRALHRIAESHPGSRLARPRLLRHGPGRHTVELPADDADVEPYPIGLLADLLTEPPDLVADGRSGPAGTRTAATASPCGTLPRTQAVMPVQQERLAGALARPDHHVEQLVWRWHGPLDAARFGAAWQAVGERESVLRTAFVWDPRPRAVVYDHGGPEVVRHGCGTAARRAALRVRERARGFDLRRPGLLRVALLDGPADGSEPCTDVLLTYHRALLDSWSVRLLMRECCRAHLAGGVLPGGERRPDLGDCARWLSEQDLGPARDFWDPARGSGDAAHGFWGRGVAEDVRRPGPPVFVGSDATGVHRTALSPAESTRLADWAARWGVAESSVLQAVWALLRYRARGAAPATTTVGFGLGLPGRGLLLEGIEGTPGPFENALPMSVAVGPGLDLPGLLRELRDRALDMAAYEWVAAGDMGGPGGGAPAPTPRAGGLLVFDGGPRPEEGFAAGPGAGSGFESGARPGTGSVLGTGSGFGSGFGEALAARGVRVREREIAGALTGYALVVRAGYDAHRGLVLTCAYDRDLVDGGAARMLLAHTARLLRLLPERADGATTVGDVLEWLSDAVVPQVPDGAGPFAAGPAVPLVPLREAAVPSAATVCLIDVPGAPRTGHGELVRHYHGPEALTALRLTAAEDGARVAAALGGGSGRDGRRLVLGGYSGSGALACALARHLTASGVRPPRVVIGGAPGDTAATRGLARTLQEVSA